MLIASSVPYGLFPLLTVRLDMLHYTATYFFGLMCFLFFWGGLFKSISVRVICDLLEEETRMLYVRDIYEKYLLTESFKGRLEILIQSNYLSLDDNGKYKLTGTGQKFVRRVGFIQKIYKISASG
jgi:predicted transcriptional regulator